jgi:hypothetical protein
MAKEYMTPAMIKAKHDVLKADRSNVEHLWELIEQFVMPFRGEFYRDTTDEQSIDWRKRRLYDSTAVIDAQNLAAAIQSNIINPASRWFDMVFRDKELMNDDAAREWIEACANEVYFALNESNFNVEAPESILDMVGFGTSILNEESEDKDEELRIDFSSMPIKEVVFEESTSGGILSVFRLLQWTALAIKDKFPEGTIFPKKIQDVLGTDKEGVLKFKILFCVHRRELKADAQAKVLAADQRQFASRYIFYDDPIDIGEQGGYYEMPTFIPRFRKTSDSKWGHSPSAVALADILSLNELVQTTLENAAKVVDPPTLVTKRGLLSNLDLGRGGLTVVKSMDDIKDYVSSARFDVGNLEIKRLQDSIHRAFYVDQLELKDSPVMTATEAQIRYELMQRLLGPTSGRFYTDWLNPCVSRTFNILYRGGRLPEMPQIVLDKGAQYDIVYTGPMARSHKREQVISIQNWMSSLVELGAVIPDVLDVPDPTKAAVKLGTLAGVPADIMRSEDEINTLRKQKQEAAQAAQKAELAKAESEAELNRSRATAGGEGNGQEEIPAQG